MSEIGAAGRRALARGAGGAVSRRRFLGWLGAAGAAGAIGACAPKPTGRGPNGNQTVQLVYQDWRTPWFPALAREMLQVFHASHPNIHVFYTPDPEPLDETIVADFQAGTAPDVLAGCCDFFSAWAQKGYLLDLRPFVAGDLDGDTLADWDPAQVRALFRLDGQQFALPKYHGALALYYNRDAFDAAGQAYPDASWGREDYEAAMRRLRRPADEAAGHAGRFGSMLDVSWERIQVHVNAWGGHFVDPDDPTRSRMAEPEALAALRWLRERMQGDHTMATALDVQNRPTWRAFTEGRLAMVEEGSWALKDILENAPFRLGVAPMPGGPARRATLATTDGFAINAQTKYPEAAWELMKFLISPAYGEAMARAHLLQPARASLVQRWAEHIRDAYPVQARELDLAAFAAGQLEGYSVTAEIFANMAAARQLAREAWQEILVLGQAPVERMRLVSEEIQRAQRPSA